MIKLRSLFPSVIKGLFVLLVISCLTWYVNISQRTSHVDSRDSRTMTPSPVDVTANNIPSPVYVTANKIYPASRVTYSKKSQRYVPMTWVKEQEYNSTIHTRHSESEYPFLTIRFDKFREAIKNPKVLKEKCSDADILIHVSTSTVNREKRRVIRENWGVDAKKSHVKIAVVFIVGESENSTVNELLEKEKEQYSDIIQGTFLDKYNYLTIKSLMAISWIHTYCPHVPKIVKIDDDFFLNIQQLVQLYVDDLPKRKLKTDKVIACYVTAAAFVMRYKTESHYVPYAEYAAEKYPNHCSGMVFVMYNSTVHALYTAAHNQEFFYVDDVLVTGFLAKKAGVEHVDIKSRCVMQNLRQTLPKINADTILFNLWQILPNARARYIEKVHSYNNATIHAKH